MNKEKAIKIIHQLKDEINKNQIEEAQIYVQTWVIGGLKQLESKINGGFDFYPSYATYEDLFRDFIKHFFGITRIKITFIIFLSHISITIAFGFLNRCVE